MKTFSFIDCGAEEMVSWLDGNANEDETVKIEAVNHGDANQKFFESGLCNETDWTNTGVKVWCWEDME